MGKIDIMTKEYMSDNNRFADVFNYFLYGGQEVLQAEELEERAPSELLVRHEKESAGRKRTGRKVYHKDRDLLRHAVVRVMDDVCYVLLGLENQHFVDYGMPVRGMSYEAMRYDRQRKEKAKGYEAARRKGRKVHMTSSEFLSGLRKGDRFLPVITLTLYFGQEEWDGPLSLHEMLEVKDHRLWPYIADYKVNLVLPRHIEDFTAFRTDLKQVLETLKAAHDKQKIKALFEGDEAYKQLGRDTAMMIKECIGMELEIDEKEETVNMCKGLADLIEEGFSAGRSEGFSAGRSTGYDAGRDATIIDMVASMFENGISMEQIAVIVKKSVEEVKAILGSSRQ